MSKPKPTHDYSRSNLGPPKAANDNHSDPDRFREMTGILRFPTLPDEEPNYEPAKWDRKYESNTYDR